MVYCYECGRYVTEEEAVVQRAGPLEQGEYFCPDCAYPGPAREGMRYSDEEIMWARRFERGEVGPETEEAADHASEVLSWTRRSSYGEFGGF